MELHIEQLSLPELVTYAARSMEGLATQKGITLTLDADNGEDLSVAADRRRLLQVLVNLLSNAINFSPDSSTVEMVLRREGGSVFIEVMDEGPGVPSEEKDRIFDKYHQTRSRSVDRGKGSGLGLAIVKKIIDLHGAVISMEGRGERQGSRFLIKMAAEEKGDAS
jgi:signal transduction histidine kinase